MLFVISNLITDENALMVFQVAEKMVRGEGSIKGKSKTQTKQNYNFPLHCSGVTNDQNENGKR